MVDDAIAGLSPAGIPAIATASIDGRVMLFAVALTLIVAVIVGMVPGVAGIAGRDRRGAAQHVGGGGPSRHRVRAAIVVAEVALALLLTTGAGLLLRSFSLLVSTDPDSARTASWRCRCSPGIWNTTPEKRAVFFAQVLDWMRARPQVRAAGAVTAMPFIEANINMETAIAIMGRPCRTAPRSARFSTS